MYCTWGYEMGWLVKDELPEKKRQQLMEDVRPALLTGERVLDATGGIVQVHRFGGDQGRRGTLAVTDRRVIIQTKRVGGYDAQDFAYGLLSGCNYATGAGFSTIELVMAGERARVTQILKGEAQRIGPLIRQQMALARTPGGTARGNRDIDPAEQLRKLAGLHDAGLLTEQEFQTKRAEVISSI
jgi:Bacterial PH domain/Short C-terminal domain